MPLLLSASLTSFHILILINELLLEKTCLTTGLCHILYWYVYYFKLMFNLTSVLFFFVVVCLFFGKKENLYYLLIWLEFTIFGKNTLYCMLYSNRIHKIFCHPTLLFIRGLRISESDWQINELSRYTLFIF